MDQGELNRTLRHCKKLAPKLIADAQAFFDGDSIVVTIRLAEGVQHGDELEEDIETAEQLLFDEIQHQLLRGQTIEFYWQLLR